MDEHTIANLKGIININEHGFKLLNTISQNEIERSNGAGEYEITRNIWGDLSRHDLDYSQMLPALVLACFTLELALKLIIFQQTETNKRGHHLQTLFNFLPEEIANGVKTKFLDEHEISEIQFETLLSDHSNFFIEGRYAHEGEGLLEANPKFVFNLFNIIKEYIQ